MIENLSGIYEIVNHRPGTNLRLYINTANEEYPDHWHSDLEILCPLQDEYIAICNGVEYELTPGNILLICPGTVHHLLAAPLGKPKIIYQVNFSPVNGMGAASHLLTRLSPARLITPSQYPDIYSEVYRLLLEICDYYTDKSLCYDLSIYSRTLEILALVGRSELTKNIPSGDSRQSVEKHRNTEMIGYICNYIASHYSEYISLESAAKIAGFSKYHFERLFKQYTGRSFYRYLTLQRVFAAERLLEDTDLSMTEIAFRSGFSNGNTFARTFRQVTQYSPTEYRTSYVQRPQGEDGGISLRSLRGPRTNKHSEAPVLLSSIPVSD